jgi:4-amino-4-deoxy-L-arabinose transferase-like glycosyltransferase
MAVSAGGGHVELAAALRYAALATATAAMTAGLTAHWLGGRTGMLAGLIYWTSLHVLPWNSAAAVDMPLSAAVAAAMGAFALANVPGRLASINRRWNRLAFYTAAGISVLLSGAVGPVLIFGSCLAYLALMQDPRGMRFLADPWGIGVFWKLIAVRVVWAVASHDASACLPGEMARAWALRPEVLAPLAAAALPWTPLALLTAVLGIRQGHDATPIWRFLGCWILVPLLLAILGLGGDAPPVGALLPPLAAIAAAGLGGALCWCRRCGRIGT